MSISVPILKVKGAGEVQARTTCQFYVPGFRVQLKALSGTATDLSVNDIQNIFNRNI